MSIQDIFCAQVNILGMIQRGFSASLYVVATHWSTLGTGHVLAFVMATLIT
jgi:hypothetical protein